MSSHSVQNMFLLHETAFFILLVTQNKKEQAN